MKLENVAFHPANRALIPDDLKLLPRAPRRLMEVLVKGTAGNPAAATRSWSLDSCLSPRHFLAESERPDSVTATAFDETKLADPYDPESKVESSGETKVLPSNVVFRSVGYKSSPLVGFSTMGIQFDERSGTVDNDGIGRITRLTASHDATDVSTQQVPGLYCSGWLKTGPTGVIASTMQDAFMTGDAMVQDWVSGHRFLQPQQTSPAGGWLDVKRLLPDGGKAAVTWSAWRRIDQAEKSRGRSKSKEREKFTSRKEMLAVL